MRAGIALDALSIVVQKALPSTNRLPKIPSPDCVFLLSVMYILLWLNSKHDANIISGSGVLQIFMEENAFGCHFYPFSVLRSSRSLKYNSSASLKVNGLHNSLAISFSNAQQNFAFASFSELEKLNGDLLISR